MSQHALLSPSSAHRWMACPASVLASQGIPDVPSEHALEGTLAHEIAAQALTQHLDVTALASTTHELADGSHVALSEGDLPALQNYVDFVRTASGPRSSLAPAAELFIEQALSIGAITGEEGAQGTADAVVIEGERLHVIDLKWGRGVRVQAEDNLQLALYALGTLASLDPLGELEEVTMTIVQPRLDHVASWTLPAQSLRAMAPRIRQGGEHALRLLRDGAQESDYHPGIEQCRFCPARATCAALAKHALAAVVDDFDVATQELAQPLQQASTSVATLDGAALGRCMANAPLVEIWLKAVRAEVETRLLAGAPVPGFKLVAGRKGARKWANGDEAEAMLKAMRLKTEEMYELKLISPTSAEKLHKAGGIGPRQWPKLQALITQDDGAPSVAPEADKRPALGLAATADDFADVTQEALT